MQHNQRAINLIDKISYILNATATGSDGLLGGKSGLALYYFYLGRAKGDTAATEKAELLLEQIFDAVNSDHPRLTGASFSIGAAGFGYLMNHLVAENFLDFDLDANFEALDHYLYEHAAKDIQAGQADFLHQAVGALHYFGAKPPGERVAGTLTTLTTLLDDHAIRDPLGWRYVSSFGPRAGKHYDLGLAHGLCGALLVALTLFEKAINRDRLGRVIADGIKFLLHFYKTPAPDEGRWSAFPLSVDITHLKPDYSNMLAWCYGDLGPALVLARAGQMMQRDDWYSIAVDLAALISRRVEVETNLAQKDAHFCHGGSGVAQCLRSLHRTIPNPELFAAYESWIGHSLDLLEYDLESGAFIGKEGGLLEGLAGVGLTLLSYVSAEDLRWDKTLLL